MQINRFELGGGKFSYDAPDLTVFRLTVEQGFAASSGLDSGNPEEITGDNLIDDSNNWGW